MTPIAQTSHISNDDCVKTVRPRKLKVLIYFHRCPIQSYINVQLATFKMAYICLEKFLYLTKGPTVLVRFRTNEALDINLT
jgi:hypothetical protein